VGAEYLENKDWQRGQLGASMLDVVPILLPVLEMKKVLYPAQPRGGIF
jgi:hypothetical protein